ncbi:hypothetical protein [Halorubrum vacuolatum]|uniref:Tripartite tricarboxylate transporter TctB family protein n=1 Tax=Halorubrum vacuolatum TaxID=63740 RepID=A0A238WAC5_HALVU|nr:hypothetical protein [Halorubrum vacuolatum]SNR43536.1 hypothetical protein SAMN06264855_106105 [Halorubrum vacuolatum]
MGQDESTTADELIAGVRSVQRVLGDAIEPVLRERPTMEHVLLVLFLVTGAYMYLAAREFPAVVAEFPQLMAGATVLLSFLILARNYLNVVAPLLTAGIGAYAVYTGGMSFLDGDGGLIRVVFGIVLLVVTIGYRQQLVKGAESFIAEPMQVLGKEDILDEDLEEGVEKNRAEATGESQEIEEAEDTEGADTEEEPDSGAMYVYEIDDPKGPVVTGVLCVAYMLVTFAIGMLYATPLFVIAWALWVKMEFPKAAALTGVGMLCSYLFYDLIQSDIAEGWLTGWEPAPPDVLYAMYINPLVQPILQLIDRYIIFPILDLIGTVVPLGVIPL